MHSSALALTVVVRVLKKLCLIVTNLQCSYECQSLLTQAGVLSGAVKVRMIVSSRTSHLANFYSMLMLNHLKHQFSEAIFV